MARVDFTTAELMLTECRNILKYLHQCLEHTDDIQEAQDLVRQINNMNLKIDFYKTLKDGPKKLITTIEVSLPRRNIYDTRPR